MKKQIIPALILILTLILTQTSCRGTDFFAYQKNNTDAPVTEAPQAVDAYIQPPQEDNNYHKVSSAEYYYYSLLDENDKQIYETILSGLLQEEREIRVNLTDKDTINKLVNMVINDHPELFYIDYEGKYLYSYTIYDGYVILEPCYRYTDKKRIRKQKKIENTAAQIVSDISMLPAEYDRIKAVFEYIIDSTEYKSNVSDSQDIYSVLVNKKSVCAGYARATQYLLQKLGIETIYIEGMVYTRGNHSWNIVKCNGRYYQLDTTFGEMEIQDMSESNLPDGMQYCYDYLCCTDRQMYKDRKANKIAKLPKCNSKDLDYYVLNGMYYKKYSDKVIKNMKKSIHSGELYWCCKFKTKNEYDKCLAKVQAGIYSDEVIKYLTGRRSVKTWYIYDEHMYTINCWYSKN